MFQLTDDQLAFIKRYDIPLSAIFDASGMKKQEYREEMKKLDKFYAIGVTPCGKAGHMMRTRAGHCLQCNPANITFLNRHYNDAMVYVAGSTQGKKLKVGYAKDINERLNALNNTKYGGCTDWEIIAYMRCKHAGKIEAKIQSALSKYIHPIIYMLGGHPVTSYEVFTCNYRIVKKMIDEIKKGAPDEFIGEGDELNDAIEIYDFDNIDSGGSRKSANQAIGHSFDQSTNPKIRQSTFAEALNKVVTPLPLNGDKQNMPDTERGNSFSEYHTNESQRIENKADGTRATQNEQGVTKKSDESKRRTTVQARTGEEFVHLSQVARALQITTQELRHYLTKYNLSVFRNSNEAHKREAEGIIRYLKGRVKRNLGKGKGS